MRHAVNTGSRGAAADKTGMEEDSADSQLAGVRAPKDSVERIKFL